MDLTPETAAWKYLSFRVVTLDADRYDQVLVDQETAVVPLSGTATLRLGSDSQPKSPASFKYWGIPRETNNPTSRPDWFGLHG